MSADGAQPVSIAAPLTTTSSPPIRSWAARDGGLDRRGVGHVELHRLGALQPGGHRLHALERAAGQHLHGALGGEGAGDGGDQAAPGARQEHPLAVQPSRHSYD